MTLVPDRRFGKYRDITPAFLISEGVSYLLVDIDNTLAPYEEPLPDEGHFEYFGELEKSGIHVVLVSNNDEERVRLFSEKLGLPAYADCSKPSLRKISKIIEERNIDTAVCAFIGDQIFTDCLTARRLGMKAYIVQPIKDKRTLLFRIKRTLEIPIMKKYDRLHSQDMSE